MRAIELIFFFFRGSKFSFFNKTIPSLAQFLNNLLCDFLFFSFSDLFFGELNLPVNFMVDKILFTLSSIKVSETSFFSMAVLSFSPQVFPGPGISISRPPVALSTVSKAAPQSLTT